MSDSLTERLRAVCVHELQVKVLTHQFVTASATACATLALPEASLVLQREVLLCDGDTPLVFACSLLPEAALVGRYSELRELGARPLGHWIFAEPILKRSTMHYCTITGHHPFLATLHNPILLPTDTLWGRKTLFTGTNKPLLVSEFFLPALAHYPTPLYMETTYDYPLD